MTHGKLYSFLAFRVPVPSAWRFFRWYYLAPPLGDLRRWARAAGLTIDSVRVRKVAMINALEMDGMVTATVP